MEPVAPGEVHPYYADNKAVIEWVLGHSLGWQQDRLNIAVPQVLKFAVDPYETPLGPSFNTLTMTRMRASGPAPYVGDPFVYVWEIGVDNLGRQVAGFTQQKFTQPVS